MTGQKQKASSSSKPTGSSKTKVGPLSFRYSANSMGVVIADPAVKPKDVSIAKIRSAVNSVVKR